MTGPVDEANAGGNSPAAKAAPGTAVILRRILALAISCQGRRNSGIGRRRRRGRTRANASADEDPSGREAAPCSAVIGHHHRSSSKTEARGAFVCSMAGEVKAKAEQERIIQRPVAL